MLGYPKSDGGLDLPTGGHHHVEELTVWKIPNFSLYHQDSCWTALENRKYMTTNVDINARKGGGVGESAVTGCSGTI